LRLATTTCIPITHLPTNCIQPETNILLLATAATFEYNDINAIIGGIIMASITIRNLDESLKSKLRLQSAQHGCSMEAEVRNILRQALLPSPAPADFANRIHQRFTELDIKALEVPARQTVRTPPDMDL
jgi:plasmid stability protein